MLRQLRPVDKSGKMGSLLWPLLFGASLALSPAIEPAWGQETSQNHGTASNVPLLSRLDALEELRQALSLPTASIQTEAVTLDGRRLFLVAAPQGDPGSLPPVSQRARSIPNSAIRVVENLSNGWSRVDLGIVIAYENDLEQAIRITEQVALQMYREPAWRDKIREPPEMHGVDDLGERGITLRIWIKVQPLQQWRVTREYRRRLKHAFDQAGIQIPFPQQALWFRSPLEMRIQSLSPEETHRLLHPMESRLSNPDPISEERAGQLPP